MVAHPFSLAQRCYLNISIGGQWVVGQDLSQVGLGELISILEVKTGVRSASYGMNEKNAQQSIKINLRAL